MQSGQTLAVLDATDIQLRLEAAKVQNEQAKLGADNAQSDYKRALDLKKGGAMTDQGIEKAELGLKIAKLQAQAADVAMRMAEQAMQDMSLRAPFAGVVTKVMAEEGMYLTTMPPSPIFILADTSALEVRVPIPERMLASIRLGTPVTIILPSINVERQAKVDRIPEVIDSLTRSAEAVIRIDNRDRALPAGLYARARFNGVRADVADGLVKASLAQPEVNAQ